MNPLAKSYFIRIIENISDQHSRYSIDDNRLMVTRIALPADFGQYIPTYLEILSLQECSLHTTESLKFISNMRSLVHLSLDHNRLKSLPVLPESLKELSIRHTRIKELTLPANLTVIDARSSPLRQLNHIPDTLETIYTDQPITQLTLKPEFKYYTNNKAHLYHKSLEASNHTNSIQIRTKA